MGIMGKVKDLGSEIGKSVKDVAGEVTEKVKDLGTETGHLVEAFARTEALQDRLNVLQNSMKDVDVEAICLTNEGYIVAVIKVVD